MFTLTAKIQLEQTVNTVEPFVIPRVSLPPYPDFQLSLVASEIPAPGRHL
ncbi:conserved hypothetical protein [Salmonella enterica subsp. enterica serovar Dublin str. CT_02021853]|uniref:Uncharacterized protein n=2 Tax=Salmonella dublin TaxID=98360 RepID=A0A8X6FAH9_SALDU|nr:conserved hypothetical protein [Salmonella enterica subsp. enterica serovar Dublin str. CT_02021853]EGE28340.1 hypothetical protein SD3246_0317 [Salmonella enterica subsp. enterica serovar Dublin str. SD3246]